MKFGSESDLEEAGFVGFRTTTELRETRCVDVSQERGVYLALRDSVEPPRFLPASVGGHFKGRDPTVACTRLEAQWIVGTPVVYIGQAGGGSSAATLRKRIWSFMRFGAGHPVGHWGGRCIWQLADHPELRICWRPSTDGADPLEEEAALLTAFRSIYRARPFANLTG